MAVCPWRMSSSFGRIGMLDGSMAPGEIYAMPDDILPFLTGVTVFALYLCWSAATEMGTHWP